MSNNTWFNVDPYASNVSHTPSTHYESTNLYNKDIVFIFGSIAHKFDLFKKSLLDLFCPKDLSPDTAIMPHHLISLPNGGYYYSRIRYNTELLSDTDLAALGILNRLMDVFLYNEKLHEEEFHSPADLMESYLSDSKYHLADEKPFRGTEIRSQIVDSPNESTYPYELNTIDTGVPTDLYYEIKKLSESTIVIVVYDGFFEHLLKDNNIYHFARHLIFTLLQFMTIQDVAKLPLFPMYIRTL